MGKRKKRKLRREQGPVPPIDRTETESTSAHCAEPAEARSASRARFWLLYAVIALAAGLAYSNSYDGVLLFDDEFHIRDNPDLGKWLPLHNTLIGMTGAPSCARPPVLISLKLNHNLDGINPQGYHVVNLLIHLVTALFFFGLLRNLLRRTERFRDQATWLAFVTTLVWAVHPIHTGCITYISQRAETMMGMFFVMSFYFADRDRKGAAITCCVLSAMSKEVGAMIPFLYPFYARGFREKNWRDVWARHRWMIIIMFALSWGAVASLLASGPKGNTVRLTLQGINPFTYLMSSANAIVEYIKLIYWPHPLVLDYGWPIADEWSEYWRGLGITGSLFLFTGYLVAKGSRWGFVGATCFLVLAPTTSVLPIMSEMWAEHRMYLPSFALLATTVLLVYWALQQIVEVNLRRTTAAILVCLAVFIFSALTYRQNKLFTNQVTMWQHNTLHEPSRRAWYNLGYALDGEYRILEAIEAYRESINWSPDWDKPHRCLGADLMTMGRYDEAYKHLQLAIRYEPQEMDNFLFMGQLYFMVNNPKEGAVMFERARQLMPDHPNVHKGLAYARLFHDDVAGAFPHLLKWLGETEVNETVVKEAIQFSLSLKKENLALHIEAIGLEAGYLKERVLKRVTADPSKNPAAPPQPVPLKP